MELLIRIPPSRVYYFTEQEWNFKDTVTLRAATVERWIRHIKKEFLDAAPIKYAGLDCEFTEAIPNVRQRDLPAKQRQRAAVLQLSVSYETLVFQICRADAVPQLLREFLRDQTIRFCGAAIHNDVHMLRYCGIDIPSAYDLQNDTPNPTNNITLSLYALSNAYIWTDLVKDKKDKANVQALRIYGWGNIPLSFDEVKYAALDACLGFEIARRNWNLHAIIAM